jgi:hypothetical protein
MKFAYIAGPFSSKTREGVEANILKATLAGIDVTKLGVFPVIPHANTAHPEFEKSSLTSFGSTVPRSCWTGVI